MEVFAIDIVIFLMKPYYFWISNFWILVTVNEFSLSFQPSGSRTIPNTRDRDSNRGLLCRCTQTSTEIENIWPGKRNIAQSDLLLSKFSRAICKRGRCGFSVIDVSATTCVGNSVSVCYGNIWLITPITCLKSEENSLPRNAWYCITDSHARREVLFLADEFVTDCVCWVAHMGGFCPLWVLVNAGVNLTLCVDLWDSIGILLPLWLKVVRNLLPLLWRKVMCETISCISAW